MGFKEYLEKNKLDEAKGGEEELTKEKMDSIDFSGLEKQLKSKLGTSIKLKTKMVAGRYGPRVEIESQNLANKAGVMSSIYNELVVDDFGDGFAPDGTYVFPVQLSWKFNDGSSNGHSLLTAWWNFDKKKWIFR